MLCISAAIAAFPVSAEMARVYVTNAAGDSVPVIDPATEKTAWEVNFDGGVRPITFDTNADGSTRNLYVQLSGLDGFAVVDFVQKRMNTLVMR